MHLTNWDMIFWIPYKVTGDVKTRCIQLSLLHIIVADKLGHKMNLKDSEVIYFLVSIKKR